MQRLLTEEEYQELVRRRDLVVKSNKEEVQKLCTLAANHIPVSAGRPWGCIHTKNPAAPNCGYCDQCPMQKICPYEHKDYSK